MFRGKIIKNKDLECKLRQNVEQSKSEVLNHFRKVDKKLLYLLNELLHDKEQLDTYLAKQKEP